MPPPVPGTYPLSLSVTVSYPQPAPQTIPAQLDQERAIIRQFLLFFKQNLLSFSDTQYSLDYFSAYAVPLL